MFDGASQSPWQRQADTLKKDDGTSLPKELARKEQLKEQMRVARERLKEMTQERASAREKLRKEVEAAQFGNIPGRLSPTPKENDTINLSDPDSRIMPTAKGGFVQGYNAQMVISGEAEGGLILCTSVCTETNDLQQLEAMMAAVPQEQMEGEQALEVVVDSGYDNVQQIRRVEESGKMKVYCPVVDNTRPAKGPVRSTARRKAAQAYRKTVGERASSQRGQQLNKLRSCTIEPAFGTIKHTMKWRRTLLRGLHKVDLEWRLIALAFNCRRLAQRYDRSTFSKN